MGNERQETDTGNRERAYTPREYRLNGYQANVIIPKMLTEYVRLEKTSKDRNDAIRMAMRNMSNVPSVNLAASLMNTPCPEDKKTNVWDCYLAEQKAYAETKRAERQGNQ